MIDVAKIRRLIGGASIASVARKAGMRRENLSRLVGGNVANPHIQTVEKVASALGVPASELLKK